MAQIAPIIVWFRQDLRLHDNPALFYASKAKAPVMFLYILDTQTQPWAMGEASRWWLHHSLTALNKTLLKKYGANLVILKGSPIDILNKIIADTNAQGVYWNRCYEPNYIKIDQEIKNTLKERSVQVHLYNGSLLKEPWEMQNLSKQPFKVFTPFWKSLQKQIIRDIYPLPSKISVFKNHPELTITDLELIPAIPWYRGFESLWEPGETTARNKLKKFLSQNVRNYKQARDNPALAATSRLSPHLHFGEISPVQIWHAAIELKESSNIQINILHFLSEIAWREFSYHLLYHFPGLPSKPFRKDFEKFPWKKNAKHLQLWQQGMTGYPIVDAGMRELWHTGWMHNRVRMVVASFLIKHLLQPWQDGETWFWNTLVDADLANNSASWQWVAGSGADAAPYFRIFNPVLQGKKFDKTGEYVKKWIPELKSLPPQYIHSPWEAPIEVLQKANIKLGITYPKPIVNHAFGRKRALEAYKKAKS